MREELAAAHEARDASESAREWLLQESLTQQRQLETLLRAQGGESQRRVEGGGREGDDAGEGADREAMLRQQLEGAQAQEELLWRQLAQVWPCS